MTRAILAHWRALAANPFASREGLRAAVIALTDEVERLQQEEAA